MKPPLIKDPKKADNMANLITGLLIGAVLTIVYYQAVYVCIGNPFRGWF